MVEISAKSFTLQWLLGSTTDVIGSAPIPIWELIRLSFIVPLLSFTSHVCVFISFLLSVEWVLMMFPAIVAKFWRKPEKRYEWEPIKDDLEFGNADFPMLLVQIPMFNEKEVYKISIGAASNLSWPSDRLVIQVLDDSTDLNVKDLIGKECKKWTDEGINIRHQCRATRAGYKAGALKDGLEQDYVKECEYVAIFDADFQPDPDFLLRALPFLIHNKELAFVQARWRFVNANECFLTRMQEISQDYLFTVDNEGRSFLCDFFGFNGSGGIWRIAAINEAGGWKDRTTVEDMDLSVRAALKGWKFVYVGNLHVKSELPGTFKAYRYQQHRWFCGPANLFRKTVMEIARSKEVSVRMKVYMIYNFFFIWKIVGNVFTFVVYCVLMPLATVFPEVHIRKREAIFATFIITTINTAITTPRSIYLAFPWILFENLMSFHRTKAIFTGLVQGKRAHEWIVTEKFGDAINIKPSSEQNISKARFKDRLQLQELGLAAFLTGCGCYGLLCQKDSYSIYLFLQAIFFTMAGFGYFGTIMGTS